MSNPPANDRKTLYKEVWAEPVRTVAARYGVSDVALAKACRRLHVPLPGVGYWAKRQAGQTPPVSPLPPLPAGVPPVIYRRDPSAYGGGVVRRGPGPLVERPTVQVMEILTEPHKLVGQAERLLGKQRSKSGIIPRPRLRCLDIRVTAQTLDRALLVMDALLKTLEERGLKVEATAPLEEHQPYHRWIMSQTRVQVDGEWISFGLEEQFDTIRHPSPEPPKNLQGWDRDYWIRRHTPDPDYVPNGQLALLIRSGEGLGLRRTWRDDQTQRVETSLGSFVTHLYATAAATKEKRAADERRAEERRQEQLRWHEEQERRWEEERLRKELVEMLDRWRLARDIRAFIQEALSLKADPKGLLEWGLAYADEIDPLSKLQAGQTADE